MSKFNIFAKRLDEAFRKSCNEYNAAFHALECAQQASRDANAWKPSDSAEEKQARIDCAAVKLHDAEAAFSEVSARVWDNFKTTCHTIRAELEQAVARGMAQYGGGNQTAILKIGEQELGRIIFKLNKDQTQRVGIQLT